MPTQLIVAVLLGPLAAAYDFVTNPNAPPAIFVAQYTEAFGHPPSLPPVVRPKKRVYVTHG